MTRYRGYEIRAADNSGHYQIHHTGKGSLPAMLAGLWTHVKTAQKQIDDYLALKEAK